MLRSINKLIYPIALLFTLTLTACGGGGSGGTTTPADPANADLSSLSLSAGSLDQAFQASNLIYTATTPFANNQISVTPTTANSNATVTVNGSAVPTGTASTPVSVNIGSGNIITVVVTSEDASSTRTYTIDATRQSGPDSADLSNLLISAGSLDQVFQPSLLSYTASTSFGNSTTTVTPFAAGTGATVTVNGTAVASGSTSSPINLNVGQNPITVNVTSEDTSATKSYTVNITRQSAAAFGQDAFITASGAAAGDELGTGIGLSGTTLVIGAPKANSDAGEVFVFVESGGSWTQQGGVITAANTQAGDKFGTSIDIDGDTMVVGAPDKGAAYVFTRSGTTWTQEAELVTTNGTSNALFGRDVAIDGDTVAIGANFEGTTQANSGAAYIFTRVGTTWTEEAFLKAGTPGNNDRFGISVALSGDTLVVGANNKNAAYVFTRSGSNWGQQAIIIPPNAETGDAFGWDVAFDNGTLVIGGFLEDSNATGINGSEIDNNSLNSGAVYVYTGSGASWTQQAYIKPSNTDIGFQFGKRVALSGDRLAIAADQVENLAGAVYYFTRSGSTWSQQSINQADNKATNDLFGSSLAITADTLAIGAQGKNSNTGAAYIWK